MTIIMAKKTSGKKSVRMNTKTPTPYLRKKIDLLLGKPVIINGQQVIGGLDVVDLGCGNGRNSRYMIERGCRVSSYDMKDDYGEELVLGEDDLPQYDKSCDIILLNYVLMFLEPIAIEFLLQEVDRIAKKGCRVMVEMYAAKTSRMPNEQSLTEGIAMVRNLIVVEMEWELIDDGGYRFIAVKRR